MLKTIYIGINAQNHCKSSCRSWRASNVVCLTICKSLDPGWWWLINMGRCSGEPIMIWDVIGDNICSGLLDHTHTQLSKFAMPLKVMKSNWRKKICWGLLDRTHSSELIKADQTHSWANLQCLSNGASQWMETSSHQFMTKRFHKI